MGHFEFREHAVKRCSSILTRLAAITQPINQLYRPSSPCANKNTYHNLTFMKIHKKTFRKRQWPRPTECFQSYSGKVLHQTWSTKIIIENVKVKFCRTKKKKKKRPSMAILKTESASWYCASLHQMLKGLRVVTSFGIDRQAPTAAGQMDRRLASRSQQTTIPVGADDDRG